jgi:hypothetical protein
MTGCRTGFVEQLTLADEQSCAPFNKPSRISKPALNPDVRQAGKMVL